MYYYHILTYFGKIFISIIDNTLGFFLFLGVNNGTKKIIELHNKLYNGMLQTYKPKWLNEGGFMPNIF